MLRDDIPLEKSHFAEFPFLPQAQQYIARLDIDFAELSTLRPIVDRAKHRITASFGLRLDKPSQKLDVEIASFPVAIMMVAGVKDGTLRERYTLYEAKRMYEFLLGENDEIILQVAKFFGWEIHHDQKRSPLPYTIHFINYLSNATRGRLVQDSQWKLVNRRVHEGQVDLGKREVCRLLQEEIRLHLERKSGQEMPQIPRIIQDAVDEIKARYLEIKPHVTEIDRIRVMAEESEYPPCIQSLYGRMTKGQHLSHIERFTLVTYLLRQGVSVDGITNLFAGLSDYRQSQTRYQVEHLAGKKGSGTAYKPPNCATLRTHGVCMNPDDPVCRTIRNPLTYHIRKKSFAEKEQ